MTCLSCGKVRTSVRDRSMWIDSHADEILVDLVDMTYAAVCKKWQISTATIHRLKVAAGRLGSQFGRAPGSPVATLVLPELPAWKDGWDPSIQLAWLEVYKSLISQIGKTEVRDDKADQT